MANDRFNQAQARLIALRIYERYGSWIAKAAEYHAVPAHYMAGLVGMKTIKDAKGYPYEWPDRRSFRFEKGVYAKLLAVRNPLRLFTRSYNGVTQDMLKGVTDDVLKLLSTSFGPTQIMAYYLESIFAGRTLRGLGVDESMALGIGLDSDELHNEPRLKHLRDPRIHFFLTGYMMRATCLSWVKAGRLDQVAHIWNAGSAYQVSNGRPIYRTWTPSYVPNVLDVAAQYKLIAEVNADTELTSIARFADRVDDTHKGE